MSSPSLCRPVILGALLFLLPSGLLFNPQAPSKDETTATAQTILARWAEALGGKEALGRIRVIYIKARYEGSGGTGIAEEWTSSKIQRRQHNRLDTGEELTVYDGSTGWSRRGGRVRSLSADEIAGQRTAAFVGSLSHLLPGRPPARIEYLGEDESKQNHLVRVTPEGARPTTFFLDKTSFLPTKNQQQLPTAVLEIQFENWREVNGIKIPDRTRLSTDTGYEATETAIEIRLDESWDADLFARPADGPRDYRITSGTGTARIPMAFDGGLLHLQGRINGSTPVWLALDTGASVSLLDADFARSLGLPLRGQPRITGAGGTTQGSYAPEVHIAIADAELEKQTFTVLPLHFLPPKDGQPVVGILGFDLFSRFVVEIDYQALEIRLHEPQSYQDKGSGAVIPIILHANQPYIRARLSVAGRPAMEGEYVVDLGSSDTLMLASDYSVAHGIRSAVPRTVEVPAAGVGGEFRLAIGRLERLQVGPFAVDGPLALFPPGQVTAPGKAGNIGGRFLSRFRVIFDYSREQMILVPTARLAEREEFDMSGLRLAATSPPSDRVRIRQVLEESPAAKAGIRPNDLLLKIDGRPAGQIPLARLREMLRQANGKEFDLEIQTGDVARVVRLKLRRLL